MLTAFKLDPVVDPSLVAIRLGTITGIVPSHVNALMVYLLAGQDSVLHLASVHNIFTQSEIKDALNSMASDISKSATPSELTITVLTAYINHARDAVLRAFMCTLCGDCKQLMTALERVNVTDPCTLAQWHCIAENLYGLLIDADATLTNVVLTRPGAVPRRSFDVEWVRWAAGLCVTIRSNEGKEASLMAWLHRHKSALHHHHDHHHHLSGFAADEPTG